MSTIPETAASTSSSEMVGSFSKRSMPPEPRPRRFWRSRFRRLRPRRPPSFSSSKRPAPELVGASTCAVDEPPACPSAAASRSPTSSFVASWVARSRSLLRSRRRRLRLMPSPSDRCCVWGASGSASVLALSLTLPLPGFSGAPTGSWGSDSVFLRVRAARVGASALAETFTPPEMAAIRSPLRITEVPLMPIPAAIFLSSGSLRSAREFEPVSVTDCLPCSGNRRRRKLLSR